MRHALLERFETSDQGTFGILRSDSFMCFTSELPWRNNESQISCIPEGTYSVYWHNSPKFGPCYKVQGVPRRAEILIHSGNYVGDRLLNYRTNSHGCILPASKLGFLGKQKAGLLSVPAVQALNSFFNKETFLLEIKNAYLSSRPLE